MLNWLNNTLFGEKLTFDEIITQLKNKTTHSLSEYAEEKIRLNNEMYDIELRLKDSPNMSEAMIRSHLRSYNQFEQELIHLDTKMNRARIIRRKLDDVKSENTHDELVAGLTEILHRSNIKISQEDYKKNVDTYMNSNKISSTRADLRKLVYDELDSKIPQMSREEEDIQVEKLFQQRYGSLNIPKNSPSISESIKKEDGLLDRLHSIRNNK